VRRGYGAGGMSDKGLFPAKSRLHGLRHETFTVTAGVLPRPGSANYRQFGEGIPVYVAALAASIWVWTIAP
jgi:hypothetical protein